MGAFVAYPFVTVRTRLQAQGMKGIIFGFRNIQSQI
jgi:hypothetical protein